MSTVRVNTVPLAYFIASIKTHNYNKLCKQILVETKLRLPSVPYESPVIDIEIRASTLIYRF